jgi:hypothetical protein
MPEKDKGFKITSLEQLQSFGLPEWERDHIQTEIDHLGRPASEQPAKEHIWLIRRQMKRTPDDGRQRR